MVRLTRLSKSIQFVQQAKLKIKSNYNDDNDYDDTYNGDDDDDNDNDNVDNNNSSNFTKLTNIVYSNKYGFIYIIEKSHLLIFSLLKLEELQVFDGGYDEQEISEENILYEYDFKDSNSSHGGGGSTSSSNSSINNSDSGDITFIMLSSSEDYIIIGFHDHLNIYHISSFMKQQRDITVEVSIVCLLLYSTAVIHTYKQAYRIIIHSCLICILMIHHIYI